MRRLSASELACANGFLAFFMLATSNLIHFFCTIDRVLDTTVYFSQFSAAKVSFFPFIARFKDVRAHCYCASLVRTLFISHARVTPFLSARTESKLNKI